MTQRAASLLLHGGIIQGHSGCDSITISGGRISALGRFEELQRLAGAQTRAIDLKGAAVAPGFSDCHLHFLQAASAAAGLDLSGERSLARMLERLRAHALGAPRGAWISAFGCDEALTLEERGPSLAELDRAVPDNFLRLRHQTLHASWLNSRAFEALGLRPDSVAPSVCGQVPKNADGRFSALVVGREKWLSRRIPRISRAELEMRARAFSAALARAGITSFTDASAANGVEQLRLFSALCRAGAIRQNVGLMVGAEHLEDVRHAGLLDGEVARLLRGVKFMPPPAVGGRRGLRAGFEQTLERWSRQVERAQELGLACAFHATELEELELVLSVIERAQTRFKARGLLLASGTAPPRFRIEHGSLIPANYLGRLAACGSWVVSNPGFLYFRGRKYAREPGLLPYVIALRSLVDAGVPVAGASDAPVTPAQPLAAVCAAVMRRTIEGEELCAGQALNTGEAVSLFTSRAARLEGREGGELARGSPADVIVLSGDPLKVAPANLAHLEATMTIIGGAVVYERRA